MDTKQFIIAKFLVKDWKLCSVKTICKQVDERGSATEQKPGSGWPKTARTEENVRYLKLLISENQTLTLMLRHFTKYQSVVPANSIVVCHVCCTLTCTGWTFQNVCSTSSA